MSRKMIISLVLGFILLVGAVLLFANYKSGVDEGAKHTSKEQKEREKETEQIKGDIAEHYGIDENLLTYEEMSDVVNKIESEYEEDIKGLNNEERSDFIRDVIEEDYGEMNATSYREGYLIKEGMSESDKQQVIAQLVSEGMTYKYIRNPIKGAYQKEEENRGTTLNDLMGKSKRFSFSEDDDEEEFKMIADTEGYIDVSGVNLGYPTLELVNEGQVYGNDKENTLAYIHFAGIIKEDLTTEDMKDLVLNSVDTEVNGEKAINFVPFAEEQYEEIKNSFKERIEIEEEEGEYEIYPRNTYVTLFGVYLPLEDVVEGYTETGESIEYIEEKLKKGEYGNPTVDVEGIEMEFIIPEEDSVVNPEIIETVGSK